MPVFDDTPAVPHALTGITFSNAQPQRLMGRRMFQDVLAEPDFVDNSSGHSEFQFTTVFAGRLTLGAGSEDYDGALEADIGANQAVGHADWSTFVYQDYAPGLIPSGVVITIRIRDDTGAAGTPVGDFCDFEEELASFTALAPGVIAVPGAVQLVPSYFGVSASTTLNAAGIKALASLNTNTVAGNYTFAAGAGYYFFAFPDALGSPVASNGFIFGALPVDMASSGQGYTSAQNGWSYLPVTVDGTPYRLYRTTYPQGGALTIAVQ